MHPNDIFYIIFLKSSRLCDAQINLCFSITKYFTKAFFGLSVLQSQRKSFKPQKELYLHTENVSFFSRKV